MKKQSKVINSRKALEEFKRELDQQWELKKWLMVQVTTEKRRTDLQSNALHLWLQMVATALNDSGYDVREVLQHSKRVEIPWSKEAAKEYLWRPVQKAYAGKSSTTEPSTREFTATYDCLNKFLIEKLDIHIPWPSKEGLSRNA